MDRMCDGKKKKKSETMGTGCLVAGKTEEVLILGENKEYRFEYVLWEVCPGHPSKQAVV